MWRGFCICFFFAATVSLLVFVSWGKPFELSFDLHFSREIKLRHAVMVVGQFRGFNQIIARSIQAKVLEQFAFPSDVFILLKGEGDHLQSPVLEAIDILQATKFIHQNFVMKVNDSGCFSEGIEGTMREKFGIVSLDQIRLFHEILSHERQADVTYSHFIKLRPDEELCYAFPREVHWKSVIMTWRTFGWMENVIHDHVAIVPRDQAEVYFTAYREVEFCHPRKSYDDLGCHVKAEQLPHDVPNECLLKGWIQRNGLKHDNGNVLGDESFCKWSHVGWKDFCHNCGWRQRQVQP
jgi:hypothetical protein